MRVLGTIGIATRGQVDYRCVGSLLLLDVPGPVKYDLHEGSILHAQRNDIAASMQGDWLLFCDDDMVFSPDALRRLLARNLDVVGGLCFRRSEPFLPTIARWDERRSVLAPVDLLGESTGARGVIEVDAIGMGFTLIRRRVFERVAQPWFAFRGSLGEDFSFCIAAREVGMRIHCDLDTRIGHVSRFVVDQRHHDAFRELGA